MALIWKNIIWRNTGMGKKISFTVKVDEAIHKKLKLVALLNGQSMSSLLTEWVQNMPVNIPDDLVSGSKKEKKAVKKRKRKSVKPDENELKSFIMPLVDSGMNNNAIANKLIENSIPSLRGGKWHNSTVSNLVKKWQNEDPQKK